MHGRILRSMEKVFLPLLGDSYTFRAVESPNLNFAPRKFIPRMQEMNIPIPKGLDHDGYCFVISLFFIFDAMCSGRWNEEGHVARLYEDLHEDRFRVLLFGRAFVTALLEIMMQGEDDRPSWWPFDPDNKKVQAEFPFMDIRQYDKYEV